MGAIAEGVKGLFISRRESFVVCAERTWTEVEAAWMAFGVEAEIGTEVETVGVREVCRRLTRVFRLSSAFWYVLSASLVAI